jgi:hypothetical protein
MKWSAVFMSFVCIFLTSDGFSLNSHVYLKSNDIVPETSSNLAKINSDRIINNNEIANKLERYEEETKSTEQAFDEYYYYDDDEDEVVDEEDDNDKDNEDRAEDEVNYNEDKDEEVVYDDFNDKDYRNEGNNEMKYETELLKVTRGYAFESSGGSTKLTPRRDTNYNIKIDDNDRRDERGYSYNEVTYQGNDTDDDSERNTHEEDWPALEDDNGGRAVADYVVDSVQSASSHEKDGKGRCFFGWHLDDNGVCGPPRRDCEPGLVRNAEGNCVGPDTGFWYK